MADPVNPAAVDAALNQVAAPEVAVASAELVNLRERAKMVDVLQREVQTSKIDTAISMATADVVFANEAAAIHARQVLGSRLDVRLNQTIGAFEAVDRATGKPAVEAVREALRSGEFSHFLKAGHAGGGGGGGGPAPEPPGGRQPASWVADLTAKMTGQPTAQPSMSNPFGIQKS